MSHINVETLVGVTTLLTAASPYLAALFTQQHYSRWVNEVIALVVSIAFGVISWLVAGGDFTQVHDIGSLCTVITATMVGAKVYYVKLASNSPTLAALEWWTGGKQAGFPAPVAMAASTLPGEDLPTTATDTILPISVGPEPDNSDLADLPDDPVAPRDAVPAGDDVVPAQEDTTDAK